MKQNDTCMQPRCMGETFSHRETWVGESRQLTCRPEVQLFHGQTARIQARRQAMFQLLRFNTSNDGVVGDGFLQWVRKHVDKLSRVEVGKTAVGLKSVEKLLALVYVQFATRDHVPRIRCDVFQCVLMGDDVVVESSRSRFEVQGFSLSGSHRKRGVKRVGA